MKTTRPLVAPFALLLSGLLSACAQGGELLPFEICDDGVDNNGNGAIDCFDEECLGERVCLPEEERFCSDGRDNDGDGATDCNDNDCVFGNDCVCSVFRVAVFSNQLPLIFEGEISEEDQDIFGGTCQERGAGDHFFPISFIFDAPLMLINVRVESPDADMVVQVRDICGEGNNSRFFCIPEGNTIGNIEIKNDDPILFYVGPQEAGQTGTYRLIIDGEEVGG